MAQPKSNYDNSDESSSPTPASDPDPYSMNTTRAIFTSSSSTSLPPHIDPASLPHGLPILGPLTGFGSARLIRTINARLASIQSMIHRPLTVPEDQAVAWHTAKGLSIGSWGPAVGIALGLGRWWQTRGDMRWMLLGKLKDEGVNQSWKEYYEARAAETEGAAGAAKKPPGSVRWDGARLWVGDREVMKELSPVRREAVLQGVRALPYIGLGWLIASLAFSSYAATVTAVGEMKDKRLWNMERDLKDQVQKSLKRRRGDVPESTTGMGRERKDRNVQGTTTRNEDDAASPTGSGESFGETEADERARMMGYGEPKPQRQGGFQRTPPNPFQTSDRQGGGFQQDRYEKQARKADSSFDDDASPTGGASILGGDDSEQSGSAWERIRQNSASGSPSEPSSAGGKRGQRPGAFQQSQRPSRQQKREGDDSFAYSSSEEEKNYAREEAQKDFDARMERERAGGDFSGGEDGKW